MRTSFHTRLGPASLAIADLTDYYSKGLIITRLNTPKAHRGQGHASALLKRILAEADTTGTTLWLEIAPSDGLDFDALEAWYSRHGFSNIGGIYRRKPNHRKETHHETRS